MHGGAGGYVPGGGVVPPMGSLNQLQSVVGQLTPMQASNFANMSNAKSSTLDPSHRSKGGHKEKQKKAGATDVSKEAAEYEAQVVSANDKLFSLLQEGIASKEAGAGGCFHSQVAVKNAALKRYRRNQEVISKAFPLPNSVAGADDFEGGLNEAKKARKGKLEGIQRSLEAVAEKYGDCAKTESAFQDEEMSFTSFQEHYAELCRIRDGAPPPSTMRIPNPVGHIVRATCSE